MSKFNNPSTRPAVSTPMTTTGSTTTYEGGTTFVRDPRSELLLLAVTNMVGEDTFYEKAANRDARFRDLVGTVACLDPEWMVGFIGWLRGQANMRSASVVAACEAAKASLDTDHAIFAKTGKKGAESGYNRKFISAACLRADEPGEILAYWTSRYGRKTPKPVKRGVADAAARLYSERSLLKYDSDAKGYRFGDVIDLTHPSPADNKPWQGALFKYALDRRHNREVTDLDKLPMIRQRQVLTSMPVEQRRPFLLESGSDDALALAGMTWESVAGWLQGPMDAKAWEAVIPLMGAMALTRNLRNFDQAGVSDKAADKVIAKLSDPEEITQSRQFPYRFLSAYREVPSLRWGHALDKALDAACQNIPSFDGKTLVLVDTSASMTNAVSQKSKIRHVDIGALFGVALAKRGADVDLYGFAGTGTGRKVTFEHKLTKGGSVLKQTQEFTQRVGEVGHGTQITEALRETFKPGVHKRVVVITDMQTMGAYGGSDMSSAVSPEVPLFAINTTGYQATALDLGTPNRYEVGGFNDKMFTMIDLLSRGRDAGWPWEQ